MFAENVFPPLPSELILPFAAFQAARGELHWAGVIVAGTLGSLLGALPWYLAGRLLGLERVLKFAERHGRWLTLSRNEVERAERWFCRRGPVVLVLGRMVPAMRTLISLPAGVSRLSTPRFFLWSAVGAMLWCSALTAVGLLLAEKYERVAKVMDPVSTAILVGLLAGYAWRVVRFRG